MRATLFFLFNSFLLGVNAQPNQLEKILPEILLGFTPTTEVLSKELSDGTIRLSRKYTNDYNELVIKLSVSSDENLDKNLEDIGTLINTLVEMSETGVMTVKSDQGQYHTGIFTVISRYQGVAGGLFLVRDRYLLEIEVIGAQKLEEAREVFDQLDLSKLD